MGSHKTCIQAEKRRMKHLPDASNVDSSIISKGMISMDEQHAGSKQRESAYVTQGQRNRLIGYPLFKSERGRICFQDRRTQSNNLAGIRGKRKRLIDVDVKI